jgi:hypothetical protein
MLVGLVLAALVTSQSADAPPAARWPLSPDLAEMLPASGKRRVTVAAEAPRAATEGAPTRFVLFRLPEASRGTAVEVASLCHCMGRKKELFVPQAALLDDELRVVRAIPEATFFPPRRGLRLSFGDGEGVPRPTATIAIDDDRSRYLIVYTDPMRVGDLVATPEGPSAGGSQGHVGGGITLKSEIRRAWGGTLEVKVSRRN